MGKNAGKTSAVMQNEDMSMFNAYDCFLLGTL